MGISIAWRDNGTIRSHYFPFRHVGDGNYDREDLSNLARVLEAAPFLVFHNAKFDLTSLESLGIEYRGQWFDTAVMAYLVNENFPASKQLDTLVKHYVGPHVGKEKSQELQAYINVFGWGGVPADIMRHYATMDAHITLELATVLFDKLQEEGLVEYWQRQKMPLMEVVRQMQKRGIRIDQAYCKRMVETAEIALEDYKEHLNGRNPASFKDMHQMLCVELGLPPIYSEKRDKKTREVKRSQTFDRHAMAEYEVMLNRLDQPLAEYILGYRGWQKAKSAFYGAYLKHMSPDGRIRPQYRHHKDEDEGGTITGRLSCADPNLQQIPKESKKPWNGGVKRSFIPSDGYELWEVDYSQLELRLGTCYATEEESLRDVFNNDRDIFTEMAAMLGMSRQDTKTLVYSMQYGAGINRLMNALGLTQKKAQDTRDNYFRTYPGFKRISDVAKYRVEKSKQIALWSGRKRRFANAKGESYKALNSLIQGGAADIMERSMIRVWNEVDQQSNGEVRMLLQVHDSIIFEIKQGTSEKWIPKIMEVMSDVSAMNEYFDVKFAVDAKPLHERYQG